MVVRMAREFRLSIPARRPRRSAVLKLAAREKGEFGEKLPSGWPRHCIAPELQHHVAMVADVAVACDGVLKVDRVVAAVDGGIYRHPDIVRA